MGNDIIYYHMLNVFIVNIFVDVCMDFFNEIKLLQKNYCTGKKN